MRYHRILDLIGFSRQPGDLREAVISTIGGFLGIFAIFLAAAGVLPEGLAVLIVPSMGASAVLLFAAPHAPFSQPWNLVMGHAISALIGVACWQWIPHHWVAASAAVGLAIGAMHLTRSIHPPGGATALAAVIGSEQLHELGYAYEFTPVLLDVLAILTVAVTFNWWFAWRRYPAALGRRKAAAKEYPPIRHEDFVYALSEIETFVDISEEDLLEIYRLATRHHERTAGDH